MKKKYLLSLILLFTSLSLSSCTLLNDDDLAYTNEYHPGEEESPVDPSTPHIGDVYGVRTSEVPNAYAYKNVDYSTNGKILNTYKGSGIGGFYINNNEDYGPLLSGYNYDLYVPDSTPRDNPHKLILFIHGGAWVTGLKSDVNTYVHEFANKGYITATIKYSLLKRSMDDNSLSIFRNLDEIEACLKSIKSALSSLGFNTNHTKLVIGGASSGAHLAMLYAYSRLSACPFPISFIIDAVGPVDIKEECWRSFDTSTEAIRSDLSYSAIQTQLSNLDNLHISGEDAGVYWNKYQTLRIANGMCGIPSSLNDIEATTDSNKADILYPNDASKLMTDPNGGEDLLSVSYWINKNSDSINIPIVGAYAGNDTVVGINQAATLDKACLDNSIEHTFYYFKNSDHTEINETADPNMYQAFISTIDEWCQNK